MEEFDKLCEEGNFEDAFCWVDKRFNENKWVYSILTSYNEAYYGIDRYAKNFFDHYYTDESDEVSEEVLAFFFMVEYCILKEDFERVKRYLKMGLQTAPTNHLTLKQANSLLIDYLKNEGTYQSPIGILPSSPYKGPNAAALLAELDELFQGYHEQSTPSPHDGRT